MEVAMVTTIRRLSFAVLLAAAVPPAIADEVPPGCFSVCSSGAIQLLDGAGRPADGSTFCHGESVSLRVYVPVPSGPQGCCAITNIQILFQWPDGMIEFQSFGDQVVMPGDVLIVDSSPHLLGSEDIGRSYLASISADHLVASPSTRTTNLPPVPALVAAPIGVEDLVSVILNWATTGPAGDYTGDLEVDVDDLVHVITSWGSCDR